MQKKATIQNLFFIGIALAALLFFSAGAVFAQDNDLKIFVVNPPEGETFYVGPSSVAYSFVVSGYVTGYSSDPIDIELNFQIHRGTEILQIHSTYLEADGSFTFPVSVKPFGPGGTLTRLGKGFSGYECDICHYSTEIDLPPGQLTFVFEISTSDGLNTTTIRNIIVDQSRHVEVPVQVNLEESQIEAIEEIPVSADSWIYMWRSRKATGLTNDLGQAVVEVEVLSEAINHYLFYVEPVVVNGVLYKSVEPIQLTLQPGATSAPLITLVVEAVEGALGGRIMNLGDPVNVWAIHLPAGEWQRVETSSSGEFSFSNLPVGEYLIYTDPIELLSQDLSFEGSRVNLLDESSRDLELQLATQTGAVLRGVITDENGSTLPFCWVDTGQRNTKIDPMSGSFTLLGLEHEERTFVASAPGYYSQEDVINSDSAVVNLTIRPDTQIIPWGAGVILIPPETIYRMQDEIIRFDQGWIWGEGGGDKPIVISTNNIHLEIQQGRFALEKLPKESVWFYLFEGNANIQSGDQDPAIIISSGQMVRLTNVIEIQPIPYDPVVVQALNRIEEVPVPQISQPSFISRLKDQIIQIGVTTAQILTFITYLFGILILLSIPFIMKRLKTTNPQENKSD